MPVIVRDSGQSAPDDDNKGKPVPDVWKRDLAIFHAL
jgi:hypothetical protein